jgi:hypothetical protein
MVCLLALAGRLGHTQMQQFRQMLGGVTDPSSAPPDTSGDCSHFNPGPWQEPSSLAASGPQRSEALQQLAQLVVLHQVILREVREAGTRAPQSGYVSHVHAISQLSGLPHLTALYERRNEERGRYLPNMHHQLYGRWCDGSDGSEVEAYLAWLQRGLLQIIDASLQQS